MRVTTLLLVLALVACAPDLPPEQLAAHRAQSLLKTAGHRDATVLAPIAGLDGEGRPGVCGLIETADGPVRVVVELTSGETHIGVPAVQGGHRADLGESRYCSEAARTRWEQVKKVDPVGLVARIGA